jgi:hypothetical protein
LSVFLSMSQPPKQRPLSEGFHAQRDRALSVPTATIGVATANMLGGRTAKKNRRSGRPVRVVDLLERGDHAGINVGPNPVEEIVHRIPKRGLALG